MTIFENFSHLHMYQGVRGKWFHSMGQRLVNKKTVTNLLPSPEKQCFFLSRSMFQRPKWVKIKTFLGLCPKTHWGELTIALPRSPSWVQTSFSWFTSAPVKFVSPLSGRRYIPRMNLNIKLIFCICLDIHKCIYWIESIHMGMVRDAWVCQKCYLILKVQYVNIELSYDADFLLVSRPM